ncbi:hypothetical protein C8Q72DRAFT_748935, partial [Fomitopsis betulina]
MARLPTYAEICQVAEKAVSIFSDNGYESCLFGSTACALYGGTRCPNDVDLVVLADEDTEDLKHLLTEADDQFFLVPSRRRSANYEVLWYELPSNRRGRGRQCKVDILVPGDALLIPDIPSRYIKHKDGLPVVPALPLLLMKLQGWTDHRYSNRRDFQEKELADVEDIEELLSNTGTHIDSKQMAWLPEDFVSAAQERV